jgi:acetate kinase
VTDESPAGRVLVVNAGSSSLKLSLLDRVDAVVESAAIDKWDGDTGHGGLADFVGGLGGVDAVGHRVVHGGRRFTGPVVIDDAVITAIGALADLAPLHQPRALAGIKAVGALLPDVPAVACFDTSFHAGLPAAAATYAVPLDWRERFGLRRYGFHGLSHAYAARRGAQLAGGEQSRLRIVSCHLGAGASVAAVQRGSCVDTSMGFTPVEGLVMATRSGSVDPGMIVWLQQHGLALEELSAGLEFRSGLAGLACLPGGSGDMREVSAAADAGSAAARLAIDVYVHRLRRETAAMAAAMNGLDVLVFTGGVGEHAPRIRAGAANGLGFLGVALDEERNTRADGDTDMTVPGAAVRAFVVAAREDIEIARQVKEVLQR